MLKYFYLIILILCYIPTNSQVFNVDIDSELYSYLNLSKIPFQPENDKKLELIELANREMWSDHNWRNYNPGRGYANLSIGVNLETAFPDPDGLLTTAYSDLHHFFQAGNVLSRGGDYTIEIKHVDNLSKESFHLDVEGTFCRISASDIEGIRRAIFFMEEEMLRNGGAYLLMGTIEKSPILNHRISRCFYGPIKRPGNLPGLMLGDELLDEENYYPDNYLNRLAHEGVNGLWITLSSKMGDGSSVGFGDLVSTSITKIKDSKSDIRLEKLRDIVNKCLRYGIRIYLKTMEPHVPLGAINDSILENHPNILGNNNRYLCASNEVGQRYLYESVNNIFKLVPNLGGIINISHGELYTTCLSALPATGGGNITCPTCSKIPEWKILHNSLSAMRQGMQDASSDAELISWLYMPQPQTQSMTHTLANWVYTIPSHTPDGVILQFNFESGVRKTIFGKELIGGDYWIASPGPSTRFERIAEIAKLNDTKVSAKIQTGTSYSVATVPFVPVPSLIYEKFAAMRRLGVSTTMLNWIVGASPGLMNKAAGLLSFEPFPKSEEEFLTKLATIYWRQKDVPKIITAWKLFKEGYQNYPLDNKFQYFGPMNDGPVWPLILRPLDSPLSPSYQLGDRKTGRPWLPSGDRIGECFPENLTFEEVLELCKRLSFHWNRGVEIMSELESDYTDNYERILDIGLAKALGVQFQSGYNILRFYYLREKMFEIEDTDEQLILLNQLKSILEEEIELGEKLIGLCNKDPRLGYHADAEGYKYFPEKLEWRIKLLNKTISNEVPKLRAMILDNQWLYPQHTGKKLIETPVLVSRSTFHIDGNTLLNNIEKYNWLSFGAGEKTSKLWATSYDDKYLYVLIKDSKHIDSQDIVSSFSRMAVKIQPRRLWPSKTYNFNLTSENRDTNSSVKWDEEAKGWIAVSRVSLDQIGVNINDLHPIKIDVSIHTDDGKSSSWKTNNSYLGRLMLAADNPNDFGWGVFIK